MNSLDLGAVQAALSTTVLGHPIDFLPAVTSTQSIVREAAQANAPEGLTVVAGQQTQGRGRGGRAWWSPPTGGLYVSMLLRPDLSGTHLGWLTMCLALGAAEAVEGTCGIRPDIKWPNDLEIRGRKLAGILSEGAFSGRRLDYVVAGLGLNANTDFSGQPDLSPIATSLRAELGQPVALAPLLTTILERIEFHYLALKRGISPQPAWSKRLVTLNQPVVATTKDGNVLKGRAIGVLPDGALRLQLSDGREEIIRSMDVTLRSS